MPDTIAAGTRLGPYEIHELIGRGGMGEVYRAKDGRLGRQVAVKVLPSSFAADADRLKRFEREARAAGQLNHPNVVAIYDIGTAGNVPYIVSELLDGTDLRARLAKGAIPPRKAVAMGIQIAKGLAAAHAKGIAHRDLKPENLMVLSGDHLKIVDFGLAKLTHADGGATEADATGVLATQLTGAGTIMGTASYMSPEQIRQQPVDHRADLFSVGAILYEMLTARRAFEGPTPADRISAILHDTPPDLSPEVEDAAPGLPALIEHCLEKNVEDRFQCAHDLVFALQQIEAAAASRRGAGGGAGPGSASESGAVTGAPGAGALDLKRHTFRRTTYREGTILSARFASDGQGVCYGAAWEGRNTELFWAYPGNPESRALGFPRTDVLAISVTGEMAVSLRHHPRGGFIYSGMLARMPAGGGAPREILDNVYEADWSPDGRQLAIVREEAGLTRIEYPVGKVLFKTAGWIGNMRVSPDGKLIAFMDHPFRGNDAGGPSVVDLSGNVKQLSPGWSSARGLAWSPDGREIVFTAFRMGVGRSLYRVTPDGVERPILEVPGHMTLQDISRQGAALIVLENERMRMQFARHGQTTAQDLSWLDWTLVRDLSSDGSRILFDETGVGGGELHAVYLRGTDGSPAIRLGDGIGFSFSPDGQWALGAVGNVSHGLTLLPCGAGEGRFLELQGLEVIYGGWFPDGMSICMLGHEPGKGARLFRVDPVTGKHEPFSEEGITSFDPLIAPDGLRVACQGPDRRIKIYPVDGSEPKLLPGVLPNERMIRWSEDGAAAYVFGRGELPAKIFKIDIATGERALWKELSPPDPTGVEGITSIRMTPVGDSYGYSYAQRLNDLYVVEGLF